MHCAHVPVNLSVLHVSAAGGLKEKVRKMQAALNFDVDNSI